MINKFFNAAKAAVQKEQGCKKYIFIIGYGGDMNENDNYLRRDRSPLKIINKKQLNTKFFKMDSRMAEDNELNLFRVVELND